MANKERIINIHNLETLSIIEDLSGEIKNTNVYRRCIRMIDKVTIDGILIVISFSIDWV